MSACKNRVAITVAALLAVAALMMGLFFSLQMHKKKKPDISTFHGTVLQEPRAVEKFALTGTNNASFDNQSLQGQWTLIFFGFSNCGYLCPTTMAELGKTYKILEQKGFKPLPRVVMISIDPKRDSINKLSHYVTAFDPHFYGARAEKTIIKQLTSSMGIAYAKVSLPGKNPENYDIQHSGTVMLINPKGELNAFFTMPHKAAWMAEDYERLAGQETNT